MGLLSPALTVVVQNSVPVARMGSATTSQQLIIDASLAPLRTATLAAVTVHPTLPRVVFTLPRSRQQPSCVPSMSRFPAAPFVRQVGAALGVSAFVLAATVGGFRIGLLVMIAVSAATFACILALPAHSLHAPHEGAATE